MTHRSAKTQGRGRPALANARDLAEKRLPRPARLVQITDSHLFADPHGKLLGLTTRSSFEAVLALALGGPTRADALVMTGDLVHDESPEGYAYLKQALQAQDLPYYCIPGNHDRSDLLAHWLGGGTVERVRRHRLGRWSLILLDSTRPGTEGGLLASAQLEAVDRLLGENTNPALVFLHQHPVPVHSAWMDTIAVENGHELVRVCDQHPNVRALVFGHIHQEFDAPRGRYRILGAPSTCVQFLPRSLDFAIDPTPPGYRELLLHPDGRLDTWVRRLAAYPERLDIASNGY